MEERDNVLDALRNSDKGRLQYDTHWLESRSLKDVIEECTSPPALSALTLPRRSPAAPSSHHRDTSQCKSSVTSDTTSGTGPVTSDKTSGTRPVTSDKTTPLRVSTKAGLAVEKRLRSADADTSYKARLEVENRRRKYEAHTTLLLQQAQSQLYELYFRIDSDAETQLRRVREDEEVRDAEVQKKHKELKEHHRQHARVLDEKLREANKKQKEDEDQRRKIQEMRESQLRSLVKLQEDVKSLHDKAAHLLASCQHQQHICDATKKSPQIIMQVHDKIGSELLSAHRSSGDGGGVLADDILHRCLSAVTQAKKVFQLLTTQVVEANKAGREAADKEDRARQQQEGERRKRDEADRKAQADAAQSSAAIAKAGEVLCITPDALTSYEGLQNKLKDVQNSYKAIVTDVNLKKYKFSLQKAVNMPVNAIAPTSGAHLRDKLQRLCVLLSGQAVDVGPGGARISAADQPGGVAFCKDLLAKKLVKQGDEQVSSNHESAFAVAAVAVGVWCEHPDLGELLLAHFYLKCPYLVPYYLPQHQGQAAGDYYRSLGYNYEDDGQIEKQDKFLRRMTGVMRLYAAVMVSTPPRGGHPHGVEHGWAWLCRVLSLQPRPYITATLLYDFLYVAGFALMKAYGKQFIKLLRCFIADYLPRLAAASPAGAGGPLTRLQTFIEGVVGSGRIAPPDGLLPPDFWYK